MSSKTLPVSDDLPPRDSAQRYLPYLIGIALILIIGLLLITRFYRLDHQAFHHDESIHCYYSWKIATEGFQTYKYDPVYHGPFLYHFGSLFHRVLPDTNWMARVPFSLVGTIGILMFLLLRRFLGWGTVLIIMGLMTLSPIVTYYTRFARNDMYMTTWMIGMVVFGIRYFLSGKVRNLTIASVFLALTYCTKENSYVNNFALCSFLLAWGVIRLIRNRRVAARDIFVRYLPLARLLILFGCFSLFAFVYVAIDSRVGPDTGLIRGLKNIATHATSVKGKTDASVFANATGYFTGAEREGIKHAYFLMAFGLTLLLLLVADALSFRIARYRSWPQVILLLFASLIFYLALFYSVSSTRWPEDMQPSPFMAKLASSLALKAALLFIISGIIPLVGSFVERASVRRGDGDGIPQSDSGEPAQPVVDGQLNPPKSIDSWRDRTLDLWGLVLQVTFIQAVFLILFSSVGTNASKGVYDGLYGYLSYWFKHQTGDYRIWGTWWYYLPRLLLYELLPLAVAVIAGAMLFWHWFRRDWTFAGRRSPSVAFAEMAADPSATPLWKPIATPFLFFALYLTFYMIAIYAVLNEKVAWLAAYQAFALNLLAGLLLGHCFANYLARKPLPSPIPRSGKQNPKAIERVPEPWNRGRKALVWSGIVVGLALVGYAIGQNVAAVFVRPDYGSEIINYTATSNEFADEMRKIDRIQADRKAKGQSLLRIVVDGASEWPCVWYFRNYDVLWKSVDLSRDIQIMSDNAENRRRIQMHRGNAWEMNSLNLRSWWIWYDDPKGLPGKLSFFKNVGCFFVNCLNDHLEDFPPDKRPDPADYPKRFTAQVLRYVFGRQVWYPTAGEKVLACYKTDQQAVLPRTEHLLEGADQAAEPITAQASWGAKGSEQGQLLEPRGLAFAPSGNLVITDSKNGSIKVFTPGGQFVAEIGKGILSKEISGPCDVACDVEGNFYVADTWSHAVRKFSSTGNLLKTVTEGVQDGNKAGLFGPRGIDINSKGIVYVTDTGNKYVRVYSKNLDPLFSWGGAGEEPGRLNEPVGIAIDSQDRVYVADMGNGRIQRFTAEGKFEAEYATMEARDLEIVAMEPNLAILPDGRVAATFSNTGAFWLVDPQKRSVSIRKIDQPQVRLPQGIAADREGNLWIGDRETSIIVKVKVD